VPWWWWWWCLAPACKPIGEVVACSNVPYMEHSIKQAKNKKNIFFAIAQLLGLKKD
jgi:hypothetical protein